MCSNGQTPFYGIYTHGFITAYERAYYACIEVQRQAQAAVTMAIIRMENEEIIYKQDEHRAAKAHGVKLPKL